MRDMSELNDPVIKYQVLTAAYRESWHHLGKAVSKIRLCIAMSLV